MNKIAVGAIAVAIIVIVVALIFVFLPVAVKPTVTFKGWIQGGVQVTTAKVDVPVTLRLEVTHAFSVEGTLKVEIREDLKETTDKAVATREHGIGLTGGNDTQIVETTFTPTSETKGISMGYFYRLSWNDELFYDPKDRNSRNQLTVGKEAEGVMVTQTFDGWYQNGIKLASPSPTNPEAKVNVPVTLTISVTNNGGDSFNGTVKVEIRKDIKDGNDKSVGFYPSPVSVGSGKSVSVSATFTPDEKTTGSLRGYFYKVYVGDLCIYDPTNPDSRPELKVTEIGGSAVTWEPQGEWEST